MKSLAIKYRPSTWDDVVEQGNTAVILQKQVQSGEFKNAYLFCGPAGCGKTTCARIFANELNHGQGNPIELDAASNNSVDDVRAIAVQAKTQSLNSEYKVFILDECHALSNNAWQAMLKLIEEPPAKSVFIFCTTDPQKIPKTIISRVQRYDFTKISQDGIVERLMEILLREDIKDVSGEQRECVEYIAKLSNGGMRDAITALDKCLAFSSDLRIRDVVDVLGVADYPEMFSITNAYFDGNKSFLLEKVDSLEQSGKDLKQFVFDYLKFVLDVLKFGFGCDWKYISIPPLAEYKAELESYGDYEMERLYALEETLLLIQNEIKYSPIARYVIEARLMLLLGGEKR